MVFTKRCIITQVEQRHTKPKDGSQPRPYFMITVLDVDSGRTTDCMYKSDIPLDVTGLKKMDSYDVKFFLNTGKFVNLSITSVTHVTGK